MKRLCVFDLDGTLVDSVIDIAEAVNRSLHKLGKEAHPVHAYYQMVGNGMEMLCRRALGHGTEEELRSLIQFYREDYVKNCCVNTAVYPGIQKLVFDLNSCGVKLAILSNKPQEQTNVVVETLFPQGMFEVVIGASSRFPRKPDSTALTWLIKHLDVALTDVVYIGDSDVDMQLAKNAGIQGLGVAWGFRGRNELEAAGASYVAENPRELEKYLLKGIES